MPPGPLYNWLCVLHSASEILAHAAAIRATQLAETNAAVGNKLRRTNPLAEQVGKRNVTARQELANRREKIEKVAEVQRLKADTFRHVDVTDDVRAEGSIEGLEAASTRQTLIGGDEHPPASLQEHRPTLPASEVVLNHQSDTAIAPSASTPFNSVSLDAPTITLRPPSGSPLPIELDTSDQYSIDTTPKNEEFVAGVQSTPAPIATHPRRNLQASRVPSSRLGRLFHYGGLAASLGYGAASEALRRVSSPNSDGTQTSLMMSSANVSRLVEKLSMMRGAALKLGQFMSIQDSHLLPKDVEEVFRRVQDSAHYMPNWQMERVLSESFGSSWVSNFTSFDPIPFAAASLGQVHSAVLSGSVSPTGEDEKVAVKIQFPDIAKSIDSDLGYLKVLLTAGKLLPRGLFLDKTIKVMKGELADECDYKLEASAAQFFSSPTGLGNDPRFRVPWVWEGSTRQVLVMQFMDGVSVGGNVVDVLSQDTRDEIATRILDLCMKELFEFRMMQTDPNWSNFLWNEQSQQIELIDFGATRSYSKEFIDKWMHILQAAVTDDRDECVRWSLELGYLTGEESESMLDAHVRSLTLLATPFRARAGVLIGGDTRYEFGRGSEWANITGEIRGLIPTMLSERLTPPPRETYSLNRKLSGAFLLASRLSAKVDCRAIWEKTVAKYEFDA